MDDNRISRGVTGDLFEEGEGNGEQAYSKEQEAYKKLGNWFIPLLGEEWFEILKGEFRKNYMVSLGKEVARQRQIYTVYPEKSKVFEAFRVTPYSEVKLVVIAQDPYHNGSALGLAFGNIGSYFKTLNPSLQKIFGYIHYKEEIGECHFPTLNDYTMSRWAEQGTLLLNRVLTVQKGIAGSHRGLGWEIFTEKVIQSLNNSKRKIVFMLWGKDAKSLEKIINTKKHLILYAEHPAAACYANRMWNAKDCFNKANEFFELNDEKKILW